MSYPRPTTYVAVALLAAVSLAASCSAGDATPALAEHPGHDVGRDGGATDVSGAARDTNDAAPQASEDAGGDTADASSAASRCSDDGTTLQCEYHTATIDEDTEQRKVYWQTPTGTPPADGWPAVILFQGSFVGAKGFWDEQRGASMGMFHRAQTLAALLDDGFAVITPEAHSGGSGYWDTNIAPWATDWADAPDNQLMLDLFSAIAHGQFGALDSGRLFAAGMSSGGYMTSRMAVAYPGKFRALAIMSASYCWCAGYTCYVPTNLPADHPPTLFIHGRLDTVVPPATMRPYEEGLRAQGTPTRLIIDEDAGHEWSEQAPQAIVDWFDRYR